MHKWLFGGFVCLVGMVFLFTLGAFAAIQPTCTVTVPTDSGAGSLRACLETATVGTTIDFSPATFPPSSPVTITLAMTLPVIITDNVTIDGSDNWVVLDGSQLLDRDGNSGLRLRGATGVVIRGLQIVNFPRSGIVLEYGAHQNVIGGDRAVGKGPLGQGNLISHNAFYGIMLADEGTSDNHVLGNYIGTDRLGTSAWGNGQWGVIIGWCTGNNRIGGSTPTTRNLISGNSQTGLQIQDTCTTNNRIAGNDIGVDATGINALGNGLGIGIVNAPSNEIGGNRAEDANVISGNSGIGIQLQGEAASNNRILGNFIGTDARGQRAIHNQAGVLLMAGAQHNQIGGFTAAERNLISGNQLAGIVFESNAAYNVIAGNYIGTDYSGQHALVADNNRHGITLGFCAHDNIIGGASAASRNVISGNQEVGIFLKGECTTNNQMLGNFIGVAADGVAPLGNQFGISLLAGQKNRIGGGAEGEGNVISGNQQAGISLQNGASQNQILGNRIGTDSSGEKAISNGEAGILLTAGAANNVIGGAQVGERNLLSGNRTRGIQLQGADVSGNRIFGNYIGIDVHGTHALCNGKLEENCAHGIGIGILAGSHHNFIGGDQAGEGNVISGNGFEGILLVGIGSNGNQIQGNIIGPDASGRRRLVAGQQIGIYLEDAQATLIGGESEGARNIISGHRETGIAIMASSEGNQILGNYIGVDISGRKAVSNSTGILIRGQRNLIGSPGAGNLISGNAQWGIMIGGEPVFTERQSTGNQIQGNLIGTDVTGNDALGNGTGIVLSWGAMSNQIGGAKAEERNVISGNRVMGITITGGDEQTLAETNDNRIQGNLIGLDQSGQKELGNQFGISISGRASRNIIGGLAVGEGNVIGGNRVFGIGILKLASGNSILGNFIGVGLDAAHPFPNGSGLILMQGASQNQIGVSNTIAYNQGAGIEIQGATTLKNEVTQNAIFANGETQITISPTLTLTPTLVAYVSISHTVSGTACPRCRVELFANPTEQPGGVRYLGATIADRRGNFRLQLDAAPPENYITATATDRGSTSAFSQPLKISHEP